MSPFTRCVFTRFLGRHVEAVWQLDNIAHTDSRQEKFTFSFVTLETITFALTYTAHTYLIRLLIQPADLFEKVLSSPIRHLGSPEPIEATQQPWDKTQEAQTFSEVVDKKVKSLFCSVLLKFETFCSKSWRFPPGWLGVDSLFVKVRAASRPGVGRCGQRDHDSMQR